MASSIYLINPASDFPTYFSAEVYAGRGAAPATLMADLAIPTIAALAAEDFSVRLCDESTEPIDFDAAVDLVGITGKVTQWSRMAEIARRFRERGKIVLIGGPFASLSPSVVRPHCDILVRGELETVAEGLFADLREGRWRSEYVGGVPDLRDTPVPRWELYRNERAVMGTVQTSRGCPFECEFCDVIQYLGRRQRHKPIARVREELDHVYRFGYRRIFLADDNFTVHRSRAKELLAALRDWNLGREAGRVSFVTQVSIDAARDDELLAMCAEAGLNHVFIGIETPNEASLRETKKRQNLRCNLTEQVQRFLDHGIAVTAGMIVGFDNDELDIFDRQLDFAEASPVPIFSLGALVAPAATPLHQRLARADRLISDGGSEVAAMPWSTNIVPARMTREELLAGLRRLCRSIYSADAFGERLVRFIDRLGPRRDPRREEAWRGGRARPVEAEGLALLSTLPRLGREEERMWSRVRSRLAKRTECAELVLPMLVQYLQIRFMYERGGLWAPQ